MKKPHMKILDSCEVLLNESAYTILDRYFCFESVYFVQGRFHKTQKKYMVRVLFKDVQENKTLYYMPTGLLGDAIDIFENLKTGYTIEGEPEKIKTKEPKLQGITFREDQKRMIESALQKQRGILKAPTGTGKTILALGIISALPKDAKILFTAHTVDLVNQFVEECEKYGFETGVVQGKNRDFSKRITCATIQTLDKYSPVELSDKFDCVLVDEAHYVSTFSGRYSRIIGNNLAPMKIGFTATPHTEGEGLWANKSFLGNIIDELTIKEGNEKNLLAIPTIKFVTLPKMKNENIRDYNQLYNKYIVDNHHRNRLIIEIAKEHTKRKEAILIFVKKVHHGELLEELAKQKNLNAKFLYGKSDKDSRNLVLKEMKENDKLCAITTAIWREGINIPPLHAIINGVGGKSEIGTIQYIGRGTRLDKASGKKTVIIYDFADPYRIISEHYVERQALFISQGWDVQIKGEEQVMKEIKQKKKKTIKRRKK